MQRGGPLRRLTPLRGTSTLKRTPLKAGKPKQRRKVPRAAALEVAARSRGRCVVCGGRRNLTRHHVLPVQRWPELELVAANMVLVCWDPCHANHEAAHRRILMAELPECAITLAHATSGAAVVFLERTYPKTAPGGTGHR
jgi:5-methylcytosine-specific restriction endonuclease McrA